MTPSPSVEPQSVEDDARLLTAARKAHMKLPHARDCRYIIFNGSKPCNCALEDLYRALQPYGAKGRFRRTPFLRGGKEQ